MAADMPDRMQADLIGRKFQRPRCGEGATLARTHEWLVRLAITAGPSALDPAQGSLF